MADAADRPKKKGAGWKKRLNSAPSASASKTSGGGFEKMGLSYPVFKGVQHKGYKVPTPIQRKCIPLLLDGKDVVAMARTGSGKTAAFIIPMLERLKMHSAKVGVRALILSPTRELATQTWKFVREIGKHTDLRTALVLGGDSMDQQFSAIHENPDVIVATPGRLLHLVVEMDLSLGLVEVVVFDECDRLFEMGFAEQVQELIGRFPNKRQTCLFSATLPKLLLEFAKAGLTDPTLVRLDVETKLSENLQTQYLAVRRDEKTALLVWMLKELIGQDKQTVVFCATKHHVEYLKELLARCGIECAHCYGNLDMTARKIEIAKFRLQKVMILIVTDVAARGIDIPMLDCVINYDFPSKPKLFVHRVGRVARAGRTGIAYSFVAPTEVAYLLDLMLFLGRALVLHASSVDDDSVFGAVPQPILDVSGEGIRVVHRESVELDACQRTLLNAYKLYDKSKELASPQSNARAKEYEAQIELHPLFKGLLKKVELDRESFVKSIAAYRPPQTIFEINKSAKFNTTAMVMKNKRQLHQGSIEHHKVASSVRPTLGVPAPRVALEESTPEGIQNTFGASIVAPGRNKDGLGVAAHRASFLQHHHDDPDTIVPSRPADSHSERGLSLVDSFARQSNTVAMNVAGDEGKDWRDSKQKVQWDRKKMKFVHTGGASSEKRIKTESGRFISASYKKDLYKEWVTKNKLEKPRVGDDEGTTRGAAARPDYRKRKYGASHGTMRGNGGDDGGSNGGGGGEQSDNSGGDGEPAAKRFARGRGRGGAQGGGSGDRGRTAMPGQHGQLKSPATILKDRERKAKEQERQAGGRAKRGGGGRGGRGGSGGRGGRGGLSAGKRAATSSGRGGSGAKRGGSKRGGAKRGGKR